MKIIKYFALVCLIAILLSLCAACVVSPMPPYAERGVYIGGQKTEISFPTKNTGHYSLLEPDQKYIYAAALKAVELGMTDFKMIGVDHEKYLDICEEALTALFSDHPEFFWLNGSAQADSEYTEGSQSGNVRVTLFMYDYWKQNDLHAAKVEFEDVVSDIVADAEKYEDIFDRVKFVHDTIIKKARYDNESYEASEAGSADRVFADTAYGALVKGKTLCAGYAGAFMCIMRRLGIETFEVSGSAGGGNHAWNILRLDNDLYHIDLTWDDRDESKLPVSYNYFCLNDREISLTHTLKPDYSLLESEGRKYNYYIHENLFFAEYDLNAIRNVYLSRKEKDTFTLKFADEDVFLAAFDGIVINNDLDISSNPITYVKYEDALILTLILS